MLPWGGGGSDQPCHQEGPCHSAHGGRERGPCMILIQFHLSRAMLTKVNWPPFPQHDLVLDLRANPEAVGASLAHSAPAIPI